MPNCDLVVIGAGLAGLTAAALASKTGRNVVVIEPAGTFGGALGLYEKSGFRFAPGTSLAYGFEPGGVFQRLNEDLGITLHASLQSPCYQVALPDRRITVYAEHPATLDELRREFPDETDRIANFYQNLRKEGMKNSKNRISAYLSRSRAARSFIHSYRFSREFTAFIDVQSLHFFGVPASRLSLSSLIMLFDPAPFFVEGGFRKLAAQLIEMLLKNSRLIRYNVPIKDIEVTAGMVRLPEETLESPVVLLNLKTNPRRNVFIGIREDVIPVGMLREVLYAPDYDKPERFLTLNVSGRDDQTAAPRGMRTLCASFSADDGGAMNERTAQIRRIIPFLDEFAVLAEDYEETSNMVRLPGGTNLKTVGSGGSILNRSSLKGVYVIPDGSTPLQAVVSARRFMQEIR